MGEIVKAYLATFLEFLFLHISKVASDQFLVKKHTARSASFRSFSSSTEGPPFRTMRAQCLAFPPAQLSRSLLGIALRNLSARNMNPSPTHPQTKAGSPRPSHRGFILPTSLPQLHQKRKNVAFRPSPSPLSHSSGSQKRLPSPSISSALTLACCMHTKGAPRWGADTRLLPAG